MGTEAPLDTAANRGVKGALLGWGLALSVLLVLLSAAYSTLEVSRARRDLLALFESSERTTFLIGHIGQQLSRIRLFLRDETNQGADPRESVEERLRPLDATLQSSVEELGPLLNADELRIWSGLRPDVEWIRAELFKAALALERGETTLGDSVLDQLVSDASEVSDRLASLNRLNQQSTQDTLRDADRRLRLLRAVQLTISLVLLVGISAIWWVIIRLVRRQRNQLVEYLARVEAANADLDAFAGRIAHDLKDLINPVSLSVATLKKFPESPERVIAASERIERTTARAMALLDSLLTFSRAGRAASSDESCSARTEVQACLEEFAPLADQLDAKVELILDPLHDPRVRCSSGLLQIVLRNLIGNALKFLSGEGERLVRVAVRTAGQDCAIVIEDTGPGISEEALPRIFEPFYRVTGTKAPGTGIGLANVQRIVKAHGGHVLVQSKVGQGTRFEVLIPLEREGASKLELPQGEDDVPAAP